MTPARNACLARRPGKARPDKARPDKARLALHDIRDNGRLAQEFVKGMAQETFEADRRTLYAVIRCLEIVSEAARRRPEALRERHPELPWRAITRHYGHGQCLPA